ncbi:hypothetical protein Patl1_10935 [Pistacia atlantica]|uniref:Uncharacterized protein n=1 Tax=Pistacia atlantica TaxID=434234 RepID=A0ACC1A7R4_9ROSI|nr:hypothetical protein Patl1_10935 [Pistacia atlantica]
MVMARVQDCEKTNLRRGSWSPEEDQILIAYIRRYGIWNWAQMPKYAGLLRTGKSCRLRWMNYLKPDIKRGNFTEEEEEIIIKLHQELGNRLNNTVSSFPKLMVCTDYIQKHSSEGGSSSSNAPYASNSDNYKASPMSSKLSADDYSSLSSDPTSEIYQKQILEEKIDLFEACRELQSLLEQSFSMEGLYMDEGYGATGPGFMVPTSQGEFSDEELQNLLEQPFPVDGLDMMEGHGAKDPGFVKPISQGRHVGSYGATNPGSMASTAPQVGFSNEEFRSLMEQPFLIESRYGVEGYEAIKDLGIEESTSQKGRQEDPYPFASNYDGGNDLWPYFLMEVNDNGM